MFRWQSSCTMAEFQSPTQRARHLGETGPMPRHWKYGCCRAQKGAMPEGRLWGTPRFGCLWQFLSSWRNARTCSEVIFYPFPLLHSPKKKHNGMGFSDLAFLGVKLTTHTKFKTWVEQLLKQTMSKIDFLPETWSTYCHTIDFEGSPSIDLNSRPSPLHCFLQYHLGQLQISQIDPSFQCLGYLQ